MAQNDKMNSIKTALYAQLAAGNITWPEYLFQVYASATEMGDLETAGSAAEMLFFERQRIRASMAAWN